MCTNLQLNNIERKREICDSLVFLLFEMNETVLHPFNCIEGLAAAAAAAVGALQLRRYLTNFSCCNGSKLLLVAE